MSYLKGLAVAWFAFIGAFALWNTGFFGYEHGVLRTFLRSVSGGTFFGLFFVAVLAVVTGPLLWQAIATRVVGAAWVRVLASAAVAAPVNVLVMWLIMREQRETVGDLIGGWRRLPSGEWGLLWPTLIGCAVFAWWAASRRSERRAATV